nr:E7 [Erethizon dorsatum papillomavirus 2]WCD67578.1 E7 protein [Erethizon dorsatum papillomavirus 2]
MKGFPLDVVLELNTLKGEVPNNQSDDGSLSPDSSGEEEPCLNLSPHEVQTICWLCHCRLRLVVVTSKNSLLQLHCLLLQDLHLQCAGCTLNHG